MAAEEDNFDIDIYGEGEGKGGAGQNDEADYYEEDEQTFTVDEPQPDPPPITRSDSDHNSGTHETATGSKNTASNNPAQKSDSTEATTSGSSQGVKRKGSPSDQPVDSGATTALLINDLHWWITEDDIRGWVNQAGAEDDLKEVTFSEHKVNGKSKGQAYLDFASPQASSAAKHKIEGLTEGPSNTRKFAVNFTSASHNPFKTLPKDAPARAKEDRPSRGGSSAYSMGRGDFSNRDSGYRGRARGYDRGGYGNQGYNRNFPGPAGGYNSGGFQNNMGMMNNFNFNRGAMMGNNMRGNMGGIRGGRGAINNMMPIGSLGMGNLGMNPMIAGMGMPGFQGNQFGPGMFNQGPGPNFGGDWGQPGAKRQRQE